MDSDPHLLRRLKFPARYEGLVNVLGEQVVKVLVSPSQETLDLFRAAAIAVGNRAEGLYLPVVARSGTGKTTLTNNLTTFLPKYFTPSIQHDTEVTVRSLEESVVEARRALAANDDRVIPVIVDNRESVPATDAELAALKQFTRRPGTGSRAVVVWPETSKSIAEQLGSRYREIAGVPPVDLPLPVRGPDRATWRDTAKTTMRLVNGLVTLEKLGVDPDSYDVGAYESIGEFMRAISDDLSRFVQGLLTESLVPIGLVIVFASTSSDAGVLSQLTSGTEFGLLDPNALVDATPDSVIGRWWDGRRGLLTQIVVRLDARAFCLPPSVSIPALRRYADDQIRPPLVELGVDSRSANQVATSMFRSDLGRFMKGEVRSAFETRGTPATTSESAYEVLADTVGFSAGRDKQANNAVNALLSEPAIVADLGWESVSSERSLPDAPGLIPDVRIDRGESLLCLELTWRKGDFLASKHRSDVAQYILGKVKNYGRELGWIVDT